MPQVVTIFKIFFCKRIGRFFTMTVKTVNLDSRRMLRALTNMGISEYRTWKTRSNSNIHHFSGLQNELFGASEGLKKPRSITDKMIAGHKYHGLVRLSGK